ncbi:carbonic anhydrase 1-like isoform X2 [Physella acuta]|uniref:carbonic anhydrase 1-like isoform X2 n=1 Tax=Physella acuta TaxID=109671 RepID=UPI0027DB5021|nr:carbonic anhydrase 1-like isoform X2 [Physella acuta]
MTWFKLVIFLGHLFLYKPRLTAGPDYWSHIHQVCSGFEQSPVNIDTEFMVYDTTLAYFNFTEYAHKQGVHQILSTINVITAVITYSGHKILLRGGSLPQDFTLYQVHFHWDPRSVHSGSEHAINGRRYGMEMQIIHYRSDYRSLNQAIQQKFSVAIVSFLFKVVHEVNPALDKLLKYLPNLTQHNSTYVHEFSLYDLLPSTEKMNFYRYEGSLTYPPCSETVIWSVAEPLINISKSQLEQFYQFNPNTFKSLHNNRAIQPLNGRIVLTTKVNQRTRKSKNGAGTRASVCQKLLSSALVLAVSWVSL